MPVYFDSIPFFWTLVVLGLIALIFAVRAYLGYRRLPAEAADDWDYQVSQNMQELRLTKQAYVRAYKKVNAPRGALYIACVFAAIVVLTPLAFALINSVLWSLWSASGDPIEIKLGAGNIKESVESLTYEPGNMVWGFFTFFGILGIWAFIAAMAARRYYRNAPGLMRDELIYERGGFHPTTPLTVGANPAHVDASNLPAADSKPLRDIYAEMFEVALGLSRETDKNYAGSGHSCDIYSDGSGMQICVHIRKKGSAEFGQDTHPFFFKDEFAREDDKENKYTIIALLENAQQTFTKVKKTGITMDKITGSDTSRMRSFQHENLEIFLYNKAH